MARSRKRTGRARPAHRGTGAAITAVLLVAIVGVIAVVLNTRQQYRVTPTDTTDLIKAISSVPASDVDGADPVVRPPGTVRSFYTKRGRVTTVVYVSYAALMPQREATIQLLARDGWTQPPNAPPGRVSSQSGSYSAVLGRRNELLQIAVTNVKSITAVSYILESTT